MKNGKNPNGRRLRRGATMTLLAVGLLFLAILGAAQVYTWNEPHHFVNEGQSFDTPLFIPPLLEHTTSRPEGSDLPLGLGEKEEQTSTERLPLRLTEARHEFFDDVGSKVIQVNGLPVGPTLRVRQGDPVRLAVSNDLGEAATVHWHGMLLPPAMDGGPHQGIAPGTTWRPEWTVDQEPATLWYHAHELHKTADHVYRGLVGMLLVEDGRSGDLLPSEYGVDDIPLIVQDRTFRDGRLAYNKDSGFANGNALTVNGIVGPYLEPDCGSLRFRILNGANAHRFQFGFDDGRPFHVVASDAGLLTAPVETQRILLAPGERAEIVADFSDCGHTRLVSFPVQPDDGALTNLVKGLFRMAPDEDRRFDVIEIRPQGEPGRPATLPAQLRPIVRLDPADAVAERTFVLSGSERINGEEFDHDRIDFTVQRDTIEVWTIRNPSFSYHPFHVHGVHFQVLDRDGRPPSAIESGWKDTVSVGPDETVRIILRTPLYGDLDHPFMFHCHILEHEDKGMMGQFNVE